MRAFESDNADGRGLHDYSSALWWTTIMITTIGSEYWPQTVIIGVSSQSPGRRNDVRFSFLTASLIERSAGTRITEFADR